MCKELQGSQKIETQQAFKGKQEEKKKQKKTNLQNHQGYQLSNHLFMAK